MDQTTVQSAMPRSSWMCRKMVYMSHAYWVNLDHGKFSKVKSNQSLVNQAWPIPYPLHSFLGNPGVTHSVPTAFIDDECSGYGMGHAWVTKDDWWMQWVRNVSRLGYQGWLMNAVGMEYVTPWLPRMIDECSGYGMGHAWVTEDESNPVS